MLDHQEVAKTERFVPSGRSRRDGSYERRPFWHRHYANRGDVNHGHWPREMRYTPSTEYFGQVYSNMVGWPFTSSPTDENLKKRLPKFFKYLSINISTFKQPEFHPAFLGAPFLKSTGTYIKSRDIFSSVLCAVAWEID